MIKVEGTDERYLHLVSSILLAFCTSFYFRYETEALGPEQQSRWLTLREQITFGTQN